MASGPSVTTSDAAMSQFAAASAEIALLAVTAW